MRKMAFLSGCAGLVVLGAQVNAHAASLDVGRYILSFTAGHYLSAALDVRDSVSASGWPVQILRLRVNHYLNCPGGYFDYVYTFVLPYNYSYNTEVNGDVIVTNNGNVAATYNSTGKLAITGNASCAISPPPPTVASFYERSPSVIWVALGRFSGDYALTRGRGGSNIVFATQKAADRLFDKRHK
jgi:hypothetical protein